MKEDAVDPASASASAAAVAAGKAAGEHVPAMFARLFGPSADVLGEHWASLLRHRLSNVERVVATADEMSGSEPGAIPARVAARVFNEAQWAEEPTMAEYLSGVLASSRTPGGRDDRGVYWSALVGRLSSDQLRLHYAVYRTASRALSGMDLEGIDFPDFSMFVPLEPMRDERGWTGRDAASSFEDAVWGLNSQGLLSDLGTMTGSVAELAGTYEFEAGAHASGAIVTTSGIGFKLFRWGTGHGHHSLSGAVPNVTEHFDGLPSESLGVQLLEKHGIDNFF